VTITMSTCAGMPLMIGSRFVPVVQNTRILSNRWWSSIFSAHTNDPLRDTGDVRDAEEAWM
jgi:hypothetical protein